MRKIQIVTGEIYHICNRAVEGKNIFSSSKDCTRFLKTALLVNTKETAYPPSWKFRSNPYQNLTVPTPTVPTPSVGTIVELYALTLMPNHFHMLGKQLADNGIARFLQRLCNSYGKYYNQKYERRGSLFLHPYCAVLIDSDSQAAHIFTYIHGNPLDLIEPGWREGNIKNWIKAKKFLEAYRWSSLGVYIETKVHPLISSLVSKKLAENYYEGKKSYFDAIKEWGTRGKQEVENSYLLD